MSPDAFLLLAAIGLLVALPPLYFVLSSRVSDKYLKLAAVTAFLALDLIMFGGFTRLTDSGLGCPDWPGCYGHSNPLSADAPIQVAESALPSGPVTQVKAWIEMIHRYFAMAVGFLIIALTVMAWRRHRAGSDSSPWLATGILLTVLVQGAFGAFTVTMKLQPLIVSLHLLGGLTLLALLTWLSLGQPAPRLKATPSLRLHTLAALTMLVVQIALGGWVSSNYAVMACPDFPLCHGQWVPDMEFAHAFTLWRSLGMTGEGEMMPFQSLIAIHWIHRLGAVLLVLILGSLAWRCRQLPGLGRWAGLCALLLGAQVLTGLGNVLLEWPLPLAVIHNGGAALLVMAMTWLLKHQQHP